MRSTGNTVIDSEILDFKKKEFAEIDRISHKLVEEFNKELNEKIKARLWLERQIYEECSMSPDKDYTIIYFERKKKNGRIK